MGVDQNIVAGVSSKMTLRPPVRFLALFKAFFVFYQIGRDLHLIRIARGMLLKEVFDGFTVPLRSAISIHLGNLRKENTNIYFTENLVYWFPWWRCPCKTKFWWNQNLQDYYHDRKSKFSFGALTHSSSIGQQIPKAMELLKCSFHSLVGIPVQHSETTSRETCAYLAPDLRSKQPLPRKKNR